MASTLGEKTVRVDFNASGDDAVLKIKQQFAKLIDDALALTQAKYVATHDGDRDELQIGKKVVANLGNRTIDALEDTAMLYVKLLTA